MKTKRELLDEAWTAYAEAEAPLWAAYKEAEALIRDAYKEEVSRILAMEK
jgi:hypothetical protein